MEGDMTFFSFRAGDEAGPFPASERDHSFFSFCRIGNDFLKFTLLPSLPSLVLLLSGAVLSFWLAPTGFLPFFQKKIGALPSSFPVVGAFSPGAGGNLSP